MTNSSNRLDISRLDKIVNKTIEAINNSKHEINEIAKSARIECRKLEEELGYLKHQVLEILNSVQDLEKELKESKKILADRNKNFDKYSEEELKAVYEKADNLRVMLAVKREQEQYLLKRRNELEVRLKEANKTVERAEKLISNVGVAMGYLSGDLKEVSTQLENIQQKQTLGLWIIKVQENERQRIARDIHDGPAQSMSNVVLKAELCERLIDIDCKKAKTELHNLKDIVRRCLQDVRNIIYDLRPMSLDDLGLVPTLGRYLSKFQDETGINVTLKTKGSFDDISPVVSLTVFRIIQESMNNIKKHSSAPNALVYLEYIDRKINIHVYDNGKGFDVEKLKKISNNNSENSGFGVLGMKERVELLDGRFNITSEFGKGTRIFVEIPIM